MLSDDAYAWIKKHGSDWRAMWSQQPFGKQVVDCCVLCHTLHFTTEVES